MKHCVITCVYAAKPHLEEGAIMSLTASAAEFPDAVKLACLDCGTPAVEAVCDALGWQIIRPELEDPPRMKHLLERATAACPDADVYWTIEHDALIQPGARLRFEPLFARFPDVAAIECPTTDTDGKTNYPSNHKTYSTYAGNCSDLRRQGPWCSLNCVAYRGDAWRRIEWYRIREYPITDQDVSAALREDGWSLCAVPEQTCIHLITVSRRALPETAGSRPPAYNEPHKQYKLGVILPCRNEGDEPLLTVRNFRHTKEAETDLRFAVIDDGSEDHSCERFFGASDIFAERNETPRGEAHARNRGVELLQGYNPDVLYWFDAHVRMKVTGGLEKMATLALEQNALVCAVTKQMGHAEPQKDPDRIGATFHWETDGSDAKHPLGLRLRWNYREPRSERRAHDCQAVLGACYCMPANLWSTLGPWMDVFGEYGFGEEALCLKAWFLDIPRLCRGDVYIEHKFRRARPYPMTGHWYWYSFAGCTRMLFAESTWRRVFLPMAQRAIGPDDERLRGIVANQDIAGWREEFAKRKRHTDEEALRWLNITQS